MEVMEILEPTNSMRIGFFMSDLGYSSDGPTCVLDVRKSKDFMIQAGLCLFVCYVIKCAAKASTSSVMLSPQGTERSS